MVRSRDWPAEKVLFKLSKPALEHDSLRERAPLRTDTVALTFDDGLECFFRNAYPVLKAHSFPATIFTVVVYVLFVEVLEIQLYHGLLEPLMNSL